MSSLTTKELVEQVVQEMLGKIGLEIKSEVADQEEVIRVNLQSENPGILIGYHGETLDAFQHLLKMIIFQKTDQWPILVVDVADYRANREKVLFGMAQAATQRVRLTNQAYCLPFLSAYERKIVHQFIAEEGMISESEGEGRERRVVVKPAGGPETNSDQPEIDRQE